MKKIRIFSIFLCILMIFSITTNASAATLEENHASAVSSGYYLNDSGIFNSGYTATFTVPSRQTVSVVISLDGVSTTSDVHITIQSNSAYYLIKYVSEKSNNAWHVTLPAGQYGINMIGGSGTYAFSVMISQYGA